MKMRKTGNDKSKVRLMTQALFFAFTNGYLKGFTEGKIFTGKSKAVCVPGLNCYSCPGALFSCPIGSLQTVLSKRGFVGACYVFGLIMAFGALMGRFVCGWLCPFGLVQDIVHRIPIFNKKKNMPGHKWLVYIKYAVLVVAVIAVPALSYYRGGMGATPFCENICPSGTLFAGIPLVSINPVLKKSVGWTFAKKMLILIIILALAVKYYRPFCKYLCPLGAFYGVFNPVALYRYRLDESTCTGCGKCTEVCKMGVDVTKNVNSPECIRCGDCKAICPVGAIHSGIGDRPLSPK